MSTGIIVLKKNAFLGFAVGFLGVVSAAHAVSPDGRYADLRPFEIMERLDTDRDQRVSMDEFVGSGGIADQGKDLRTAKGYGEHVTSEKADAHKKAHGASDGDKKNHEERKKREDWKKYHDEKKEAAGERLNPAEHFQRLDKNADGYISMDEFVASFEERKNWKK